MLTILWLFGIWSKLERWKSLISGCLMNWLQIKKKEKIIILKHDLFLFYTTMNHFLIGLWHVMKSGFYVTTSDYQVIGPRRSSKALPTPNSHQKKVMVTILWSAAPLIHYSFLNPGEPITSEKYAQQIDKMHWNLQPLQPAVVKRKGPILHDSAWPHVAQPTLQKLNKRGYEVSSYLP